MISQQRSSVDYLECQHSWQSQTHTHIYLTSIGQQQAFLQIVHLNNNESEVHFSPKSQNQTLIRCL